jgi:hypothetical protein
MKIKNSKYQSIIQVMVESCYSSDENGVLQMDDITADFITAWTPSTNDSDKETIIKDFANYSESVVSEEDLKALLVRQAYYPISGEHFVPTLKLERNIYLSQRSFKVPVFHCDGEVFEDFEFQPDFDLFYKDGDKFVKIDVE